VRILFITQYFPPEVGAAASRIQDVSEELSALGHDVTEVSEIPNYPTGIIHRKYRFKLFHKERINNIKVIRTFVLASGRQSFLQRILLYASFMVSSVFGSLFINGIDAVVATSPPLFVGFSGYCVARLKRAKFIFDVRDLWPESAIALGELHNRVLKRLSVRLEQFLYRKADRITVAVPGFREKIAQNQAMQDKIWPITNVVDQDKFALRADRELYRRSHGWQDKFVVLFSGNHGLAQGLTTIMEAANLLKDHPDILFLFVGEGVEKPHLKNVQKDLFLEQVIFVDEQPREQMPVYISMSDVCLVPLRDLSLFDNALPSKMLEYMSCSRPIIGTLRGEAKNLLEQAKAGMVVDPEDARQLADAIVMLRDQPQLRKTFGESGRQYVSRNYSRDQRARSFESVVVSAHQQGSPRPAIRKSI
jgi:glycosyltransferase involved in cell wall biosynthesis